MNVYQGPVTFTGAVTNSLISGWFGNFMIGLGYFDSTATTYHIGAAGYYHITIQADIKTFFNNL